jgi:hypothetical protein
MPVEGAQVGSLHFVQLGVDQIFEVEVDVRNDGPRETSLWEPEGRNGYL